MISPRIAPESPAARPPEARAEVRNGWPEHVRRLAAAMGGAVKTRLATDAVLAGLWHCLLGSFLAGLATSALLALLVLALGAVA